MTSFKGSDITVTIKATSDFNLLAGLPSNEDQYARQLLANCDSVDGVPFSKLVDALLSILKKRMISNAEEDVFLTAAIDAVRNFSCGMDALSNYYIPLEKKALLDRSARTVILIINTTDKWRQLNATKRWASLSAKTRQTLSRKYRAIFADLFEGLGKYRTELTKAAFLGGSPDPSLSTKDLQDECETALREQSARFAAAEPS